jgi:anti-anti-sigma factor
MAVTSAIIANHYVPSEYPGEEGRRPRARLSASRVHSCTVVAVVGEIDACNSDPVLAGVISLLGTRKQLLLDLTGLDFLAAQGMSFLEGVGLECAQRSISWAVMPSAAVSRMLRVCDTEAVLPLAGAAAAIDGLGCRHLQLV